MKIAVCAIGNTPASHVAPFSGRTAGFVIYDSDSFRFTYLDPSTDEKQVKKRCCQVADRGKLLSTKRIYLKWKSDYFYLLLNKKRIS
jgi:hypothetical protein